MKRIRGLLPFAVPFLLLASLYPLQNWLDRNSRGLRLEMEALYFSNGETVRQLSLGYHSLLADLYWIRAIQYFGQKVIDNPRILNEYSDELPLLYPLLDVTTTLDPRMKTAYRFGGYFVHDYVDPVQGYLLLEKGVRNNPNDWRLYQDLAFLYWSGERCEDASEMYAAGASLPGAPAWMKPLSASVLADCGKEGLALQMLETMAATTDDPTIRKQMQRQILGFEAIKEVRLLDDAVARYEQKFGTRPPSLAELVRTVPIPQTPEGPRIRINEAGEPVDTLGVPYLYDPNTGQIRPSPNSVILPSQVFRREKKEG